MADPITATTLLTGLTLGVGFAVSGVAVSETYQHIIKPIIVSAEQELEKDWNWATGHGYKTGAELEKEMMKSKYDQKLSDLQKLLNKYDRPAEEKINTQLVNSFKK